MLRINLLPSYIGQRRLTKKLIPLFAGLFLLSVGLPLFGYVTMQTHLKQLTEDADTAETGKKHTDDLKAQAASTLAKVKPIQDKLDFVTAVHTYTRTWVTLLNTLADKSPKNSFIYSGVSVNGPIMTIKAYTPSVEEVGRYLQAMYQEPDFTSVSVDKLPAYPDNIRHLYYLGKVLVFADGASGSSSGGGGGYPGGGGKYPGGGHG
jgi:Tfp pilus assembly protein PilN